MVGTRNGRTARSAVPARLARRCEALVATPTRLRTVCAVLGVVALAVGATGTYLVSQATRSTEVSLDDVLADFRDGAAPTSTTIATVAVEAAQTEEAVEAEEAPASTPPPTVAAAAEEIMPQPTEPPPPPVATAPPTTVDPGPHQVTRPAEGVYRYAAQGSESISMGGARHTYPAEVFAVVRHTACGFLLEVRVLEEHTDRTELCLDGTTISLASEGKRVTFFGQTDEGTIGCAPPLLLVDHAVGPGATHPVDCTAGSLRTSGTVTHTHDEPVAIDGGEVVGARVDWHWTLSGNASGGGHTVWVLDPDGLPLRIERDNQSTSPTILGKVTHRETARYVLASRVPVR